ncbi:ankyrin repeat domain-containing protein [Micromonospora zhanjiangensis]
MVDDGGWDRWSLWIWSDPAEVRARLAAGADPNSPTVRPLHAAAEWGSAEVVAELAARVDNIDVEYDGRTALWVAVQAGKPDTARVLVAAGADPWRPMMAGWSPGRLSLAGPTPDLFPTPPDGQGLSPAEVAAAAEARRLVGLLGDLHYEGLSLCCVSGVDAAEAVRRLGATTLEYDDPEAVGEHFEDDSLSDAALLTVGVTDVPGGCVVCQPWAYGASTPVVSQLLSAGTVCYAMYANPKSGNQGSICRDGRFDGWDLHPGGGWSAAGDPADDILRTYLHRHKAIAYCCAYADLRPTDPRPFGHTPDRWVRLPQRDYWKHTD